MKIKRVLALGIIVTLICGCQEKESREVSKDDIDIVELNGKREVKKNNRLFNNDKQGKHDLLMLMANSVDYYNLVSGKMVSILGYQEEKSSNEYTFQVNVPDYHSYLYQAGTDDLEDQVIFRDSQKMYFFMGRLNELNNDIDELINKQMMTVEEVCKETNLFKYRDLSLEQRISDIDKSRVANDLFGDMAPYLLPEDIALHQLGLEYSNYDIVGSEEYLNRKAIKVEGSISGDKYNEGSNISMLVDLETGIILKYQRTNKNSNVEMRMERIAIDQEGDEDMYARYMEKD